MTTHPLRQWLTQRGWTQRQLAALLGVSESLVSRWLRGHRSPTAEQLAKLEKIDRGLAARLRSPTE
jgi:transcriptional regulator with XRE-family HTH domain